MADGQAPVPDALSKRIGAEGIHLAFVEPARMPHRYRTPIIQCTNGCGRWAEDPTTDIFGDPLPDYLFESEEDKLAVCMQCRMDALDETLREVTVRTIEETLGLGEIDRSAIKAFIETVFTDPAKILQVQDLHNRVGELEKQNGRLWLALGICAGLVAISIAAIVAVALALAS